MPVGSAFDSCPLQTKRVSKLEPLHIVARFSGRLVSGFAGGRDP